MGLDDVGLTDAIEFTRSGFRVPGFDVDVDRIQHIQAGRCYLLDISDQKLGIVVKSGKLRATNDFALLMVSLLAARGIGFPSRAQLAGRLQVETATVSNV